MAKARRTNKVTSRQTRKGRRSIQDGREFEDKIADLYRLLGAEVVQNVEVCQKKVDILATFLLPGSATPHRVIVECKSEKTAVAQNQRVMQFAGLLDLARRCCEAESAEIITKVAWSDQAKGFAHSHQIALLTYEQKVSQLINFEAYLKTVVSQYEGSGPERQSEAALASYYVAPTAKVVGKSTKTITDIEQYVKGWLMAKEVRQLAVLGEYGTGKTCLCRKLAHDLASAYLSNAGTTRIPILFNLRDFTKALTMESLITSFLDGVCGVANPRFQLFRTMNEAGVFLLMFDGFDEMAVRVDADTLDMNLREIEKLAGPAKARVLLTSRTEYFVSAEEQARVLQPRGQLLATRDVEYQPLNIEPWDDKSVDLFLQRRVPLIPGVKREWTFYRDRLKSIPGLSDLARRPVLLEMIVRTLPQLIGSGKPINRPNLYRTYLIGELKRQKVVKQRILLLPESTRLAVLQNLAAKFYEQDEPAITFSEAMNEVEVAVHPPRSELEAHTRDFLNCSFLIREGDAFRFSHRSIMEYLIARALCEEITSKKPEAFGRVRLGPVVSGFLAEMTPDASVLWEWVENTRRTEDQRGKYVGGNAVTLLCLANDASLAGRDLSGVNLSDARFFTADLTRTDLTGAKLKNVILSGAYFEERTLRMAEISDSTFGVIMHVAPTGRQPKLDSSGFMDRIQEVVIPSSLKATVLSCYTYGHRNGHVISFLVIRCADSDTMEAVRRLMASKLHAQSTAVYASELNAVQEEMPKDLADHIGSLRSRMARYSLWAE